MAQAAAAMACLASRDCSADACTLRGDQPGDHGDGPISRLRFFIRSVARRAGARRVPDAADGGGAAAEHRDTG